MKTSNVAIAVVALLTLIAGLAVAGGAETRGVTAPHADGPQNEEYDPDSQARPGRQPAPWGTEETGLFCDNSIDAGTSGACESEAQTQGLLVCSNGNTPSNITCSLPQGNCPNGTPCNCSFHCGSLSQP